MAITTDNAAADNAVARGGPDRISEAPDFTVARLAEGTVLKPTGDWTVATIGAVDARLRVLGGDDDTSVGTGMAMGMDLADLGRLDTAGAMVLCRTANCLESNRDSGCFTNMSDRHRVLIEQVAASFRSCEIAPPAKPSPLVMLGRLGAGIQDFAREGRETLGFLGLFLATLARTLSRPRRLRVTSIVFQMEHVGLNALPIVSLISFLIGVVLAFQGAEQLRRFGAEVFVVNLISVTVLREMGILLTAIIVAGRSGSAFTAQIGAMKVNEEIDAMRALGLDPMEVLVMPRALALIMMMPLLGFVAAMMGLLGGGLTAWAALDLSPALYVERIWQVTALDHLWVGLGKAPVFALVIALIGCHQGLRVERSAEALGRLTTKAVVLSIFTVIVMDALFSIFYATLGV